MHGELGRRVDAAGASTLSSILRDQADGNPDFPLYAYATNGLVVGETRTIGRLARRAWALAAHLGSIGCVGERVLIMLSPGLDFIDAFHGCLAAGMVAVPIYPPRVGRPERALKRISAILENAEARIVIASADVRDAIKALLPAVEGGLTWLDPVDVDDGAADLWRDPGIGPDNDAFLQYTSGSTGVPKGVRVSHGNILHNARMITNRMGFTHRTRLVGWLPFYHDMGLFSGVLMPVYHGFATRLMPPTVFSQRPLLWLKAISEFRGDISGAPNFAYDLCVRRAEEEGVEALDLSCWAVAFNGAEPIRSRTLERFAETFSGHGFARTAFYPCYGLAEASLMVTAARVGEGAVTTAFDARALVERSLAIPSDREGDQTLVASGWVSEAPTETQNAARIVDPVERRPLSDGEVGEVWVTGGSVSRGYWNQPEESDKTFVEARLGDDPPRQYLRTGDLGFIHGGRLYICGRSKDMIKINGRTLLPQDIEVTCETTLAAVLPAGCAAFSVTEPGDAVERLVMVAEVDRHSCRRFTATDGEGALTDAVEAIRSAIAEEFQIALHALVFVRPGGVPKTTSGKVRRHLCGTLWRDGALPSVGQWRRDDGATPAPDRSGEQEGTPDGELAGIWCSVLKIPTVSDTDDFFALGGDSLAAAEIVERINTVFSIALTLEEAFSVSTFGHCKALVQAKRSLE